MALSKNILSPENESQTLAQVQKIQTKNGGLSIGIPKEVTFQENRVPLTPAAVSYFAANGHSIVIESGAGRNANFSDIQFSEAGAQIVYSNKEVYECETILKIDPPTLSEIELMKPGQLLISALQINQMDSVLLRKLMEKKINAMAYEYLED
ncbi:MAG: alanine dehydrogenase, partial [Bacteroidota bacterium]